MWLCSSKKAVDVVVINDNQKPTDRPVSALTASTGLLNGQGFPVAEEGRDEAIMQNAQDEWNQYSTGRIAGSNLPRTSKDQDDTDERTDTDVDERDSATANVDTRHEDFGDSEQGDAVEGETTSIRSRSSINGSKNRDNNISPLSSVLTSNSPQDETLSHTGSQQQPLTANISISHSDSLDNDGEQAENTEIEVDITKQSSASVASSVSASSSQRQHPSQGKDDDDEDDNDEKDKTEQENQLDSSLHSIEITPRDIWEASRAGNTRLVHAFIKKDPFLAVTPSDTDQTPLFLAAQGGHFETCQLLLDNGATDFDRECYNSTSNEEVKYLLKTRENQTISGDVLIARLNSDDVQREEEVFQGSNPCCGGLLAFNLC